MRGIAAFGMAFLLATASAAAADFYVQGLAGSETVLVWRNADAQREAIGMIQAGVHETNVALLIPLLACVVPSGTAVALAGTESDTHEIAVMDGEHSGCRGNIPADELKSR